MPIFISLLGLVLFFLPAWLMTIKWFSDRPWVSRLIWFVILALILLPLAVFYTHYFGGVPITIKNVWLLAGLINLLCLYGWFTLPTPKSSPTNLGADLPRLYWLGLIGLSILVFAFPYFFNSQPIIGGDSPHYLSNTAILLREGAPAVIFDRSLIYFLPGILHLLTNLPVQTILKFLVTIFETTFVLVGTLIASRYLKPSLAILSGLALIFSPAFFDLNKSNLPFFMGITIVYFLAYELVTKQQRVWSNLLIPLVWGSLFNLHGVVAFASLGLLIPLLLINAFSKSWSPKYWLIWSVIFIGCAQPLIFSPFNKISAGLVVPLKNLLNSVSSATLNKIPTGMTVPLENTPSSVSPAPLPEFTTPVRPSLSRFPLEKFNFIGYYSSGVIFLALLGLILIGFNPHLTRPMRLSLLALGIGQFILTQQEFFGLRWLPVRFIVTLAPVIYLLAIYTLTRLNLLLRDKGLAFYLAVAIIVLPNLLTILPKATHRTASIEPNHYQFIQTITPKLTQNPIIFVAAPEGEWIQGLLPDSRVFLTHPEAICGNQTILSQLPFEFWQIGQAFSDQVTPEESVATFQKFSRHRPFYLYVDPENYRCINPDLFLTPPYTIVANAENLWLLRHD